MGNVYVQTVPPAPGLNGDVWLQDLKTSRPKLYEWKRGQWELDYAFYGGRIHAVTTAHSIYMNSPIANAGDVLFELGGGTLRLYRRLQASAAPFWIYLGAAAAVGKSALLTDAALAAAKAQLRQELRAVADRVSALEAHSAGASCPA